MKLSQALEGFYLARAADGVSQHTQRIYRWALVPLCQHLGDPEIENITATQLRAYLAGLLAGTRLSVISVQIVHRCIRAFFTWAAADLGLPRPDTLIKKPEGKSEEIQPFTLIEIERLLKACEYTAPAVSDSRRVFQMRRATGKRDRAILLTLLDTGIRAGELCRLDVADYDQSEGSLHVRPYSSSRKSRPRLVYLGKTARRAVWAYLTARGAPAADDPLFLSSTTLRFTPNHLLKLIRALGDRANVKNAHPHRLRHTMAVQYLRNRGDPFTLKQLLGLSSWAVMEIYIQLATTDLQDVHRTSSPADNWRL